MLRHFQFERSAAAAHRVVHALSRSGRQHLLLSLTQELPEIWGGCKAPEDGLIHRKFPTEVSTSFENRALSGGLAGTRAFRTAVERSYLPTSDPSCENVRGQAKGAGLHWVERSAWEEESGGEVSGSHAAPLHRDLCGQQRVGLSCEQPPRSDAALPGVQSLEH